MTTSTIEAHPDRTGVEAASWALAVEVVAALGPDFTIIAGAPGGGIYDLLWIFRKQCLTEGSVSGPEVRLNRNGSLHAGTIDALTVVRPPDVWERIASGETGVGELAAEVLQSLNQPEARGSRVEVLAWRVLAAVTAQAALYRTGWSVQHAVTDVAGWPLEVNKDLLLPYTGQLPRRADLLEVEAARPLWLVVDQYGEPVACVDTAGRLLRPDETGITGIDITEDADDLALAASLATELIHQVLNRDVFTAGDHTPGLGLASVLSAFNRKERFFVTTQAAGLLVHAEIHGASLPLSAAVRRRLGAVLGVEVPAHAYAAIDYHLSWLHAAVTWWQGGASPHQHEDYSSTSNPPTESMVDIVEGTTGPTGGPKNMVDGSQEDIDLLVCWQTEQGTHVVAIEAKAYGTWSNPQMESKVQRLREIVLAFNGATLDLRLVLTSRRRPQHLMTAAWPRWALDDGGEALWMPLSAPGLRLATTRCDEQGKPSAGGTLWKITGPTGS